jgi:hypothetical protein
MLMVWASSIHGQSVCEAEEVSAKRVGTALDRDRVESREEREVVVRCELRRRGSEHQIVVRDRRDIADPVSRSLPIRIGTAAVPSADSCESGR